MSIYHDYILGTSIATIRAGGSSPSAGGVPTRVVTDRCWTEWALETRMNASSCGRDIQIPRRRTACPRGSSVIVRRSAPTWGVNDDIERRPLRIGMSTLKCRRSIRISRRGRPTHRWGNVIKISRSALSQIIMSSATSWRQGQQWPRAPWHRVSISLTGDRIHKMRVLDEPESCLDKISFHRALFEMRICGG
jgi:hypothetical protein